MLRPLVLDGIGGEIHGADVVAVDERALGKRAVELSQDMSEPRRLRHAVRDRPVLRLSTGAGDNRLPLGRPGDQVAAQEDGVAGSRATSVRAASPSVTRILLGGGVSISDTYRIRIRPGYASDTFLAVS